MRLAAKLIAIFLLEIIILLTIDGFLAIQREKRQFQKDMQRDAHVLGNSLKNLVAEVWKLEGRHRALQLLEDANRTQHSLHIRWVWVSGSTDARYRPLASVAEIASVVNGREVSMPVSDQKGTKTFCTYVPVRAPSTPSNRSGAIELTEPLSELDSFVRGTAWRNIVLGLMLVVVGSASVVSLAVFVVGKPLSRLSEKSRQIGQGDLSPTLNPRGRDELAELARSVNDMCRKLTTSQEQTRLEQDRRIAAIDQLRRADRLRTVGQLAAGVAHELGTPLNTIFIRAGMIADGGLANGEISENAQIIRSQSRRMTAIIRELLAYARPPRPNRQPVDLREIVRNAVKLLTPLASKYNASVALREGDTACVAMVDVSQMEQVLTNLLVNALQGDPRNSPRVEVDVRRELASVADAESNVRRECVCISVCDYGEGISPENLEHIFDPFFTTKDVGEGTGLGLSVTFGIIKEHGGWVNVASQPGEGSCFKVYLPASANLNGQINDAEAPKCG